MTLSDPLVVVKKYLDAWTRLPSVSVRRFFARSNAWADIDLNYGEGADTDEFYEMQGLDDDGDESSGPLFETPQYEKKLLDAARAGKRRELEKHIYEARVRYGGVRVDGRTRYGWTSLHVAVFHGHVSCVQSLLMKDANPNTQCEGGVTPLAIAASSPELESLVQVRPNCCTRPAHKYQPMKDELEPAELDDPLSIWKLYPNRVDVLLMQELQKGRYFCVDQLDHERHTPLMYAACCGRSIAASMLLHCKASLTITCRNGRTALFHAANKGQSQISCMLLKAGSPVDSEDHLSRTPLHAAVANNLVTLVDALLKKSTPVDKFDVMGRLPIMAAAERQNTVLFNKLLPFHQADKTGDSTTDVTEISIGLAQLFEWKGSDEQLTLQEFRERVWHQKEKAEERMEEIEEMQNAKLIEEMENADAGVASPAEAVFTNNVHLLVEKLVGSLEIYRKSPLSFSFPRLAHHFFKHNDYRRPFFADPNVESDAGLSYFDFQSAAASTDSDMLAQMFRVFDMDGSGEIELKEFLVVASHYACATDKERAKVAFMAMDLDSNGLLERKELLANLGLFIEERGATQEVTDGEGATQEVLEEKVERIYEKLGLPTSTPLTYEHFLKLLELDTMSGCK